jgi:hypothetical protein
MGFVEQRLRASNQVSWGGLAVCGLALTFGSGCTEDPREGVGPPSGGPPIEGGTLLAELEIEAPTRSTFLLHGCIPVPPGTFPRADGLLPLAIRGPNGFIVPTQVEVVSSYAHPSQGADVVEVTGRVGLPSGVAAGEKVVYEVVYEPHEPGDVWLSQDVLALVNDPGKVLLRAEDVFGNVYEADILSNLRGPGNETFTQLLSEGLASAQGRSYNVMKPVGATIGAPTGALPHFFGVHAYVTAWTQTEGLSVALRVHNGFDGYDESTSDDDPLGVVYFKKLELVMPSAWTAMLDFQDVAAGPSYQQSGTLILPLISPNLNGDMHLMPHQAQLQRRLGIAKASDPSLALHLAFDEGLGFVRAGQSADRVELYSWWNESTARYWPQKQPLPDLTHVGMSNLESGLTNNYWMVRTALETGAPGNFQVPSAALGWAHPWGVSYGGMTGGTEIHLYDGLELAQARTNKGWKFMQAAQRMLNDRQPSALYDRSGEPSSLEKWVIQGASFPFIGFNFNQTLKNGPDPFGFDQAPHFQVAYVQQNGLEPDYQNALWSYAPIDFQHYVRYTRVPKVLAWLGNDAMAKDDIKQVAENYRMSYNEYPNSSGQFASGSGLWASQSFVQQTPHHGFGWGRGEAWGLDAVVSAYALNDASYRNQVSGWLAKNADVVAAGQVTCSGFIQAQVVGGWLGGQWRTRSGPEHAIVENALWGLKETVFRDADSGRFAQTEHVLTEATRAMIGPLSWSTQFNGPWFVVAVTDQNLSIPPYCGSGPPGGAGGGGDYYQGWSSLAYGYQLTGDVEFLQKGSLMTGGFDLLPWLQNQGVKNMTNQAALLATLQ